MEIAAPSQVPKSVARAAAAGGGITWCDDQQQGVVHVTRTSICEGQVVDMKLIDTENGELLGEAFLTVKQQVDTKNTDVSFSEDFFLRVQGVTGALISGFNVAVKAECVSACQQGPGPWTGPAPVSLLSEKEGTWQRNWTKNTLHDSLMLEYTLTATYANAKGSYTWGVNQSAGWEVRCDNEVGALPGCVVPSFTPTLEIPTKYSEARQFIGMTQASMNSHPGWEGKGQPLHREANETVARKNREKVCDSTFTANESTPKPVQCDEFPFAKSKESGAQQGVTSGKVCQQYSVVSQTIDGKQYLSLTWPGLNQGKMPPANALCARASMPKDQNEGVGGELGRKTKQWRLIGGDAYWVDAGNKN
ncbi:NucA/NucB deoxyribonuclease domain-containing protein [Streptomyces arenae]|uniref:NucA/NucB deoxyribonuclease domain-containing protein n=1 Tax=Streptomyces arenae TaxID=29301 RepID=UPI0026581388|nr:hypothetical protein [Streptomyces arenae]MCG7210149.1 hypothetical protein [Streptomyces arenae]